MHSCWGDGWDRGQRGRRWSGVEVVEGEREDEGSLVTDPLCSKVTGCLWVWCYVLLISFTYLYTSHPVIAIRLNPHPPNTTPHPTPSKAQWAHADVSHIIFSSVHSFIYLGKQNVFEKTHTHPY